MIHKDTSVRAGIALRPTTVAAGATAQGPALGDLAVEGTTLHVMLNGAANAGVTVLTVGIEGKRKDTGAWEDVIGANGQPIAFDAADTTAAGALGQGKALLGTLAIDRLPYVDYRLDVRTVTGGNATLSAIYVLGDLVSRDQKTWTKDHWLFKQQGYSHLSQLNGTLNR